MAKRLRFLQLSDVHLGAPLTGGRLALGEECRRVRTRERNQLFSKALDLLLERDLDGLLLPGDLFDDEAVRVDQIRFVQRELERVAPKPVFIAPGNHDPFGGASPYDAVISSQTFNLSWPSNVHIFAHEDFRSVPWPQREDIRVSGCGVVANVPSGTRRLAQALRKTAGALNILLFHGSRDDGQWLQADKSTYPFSSQELLAQGFDWVALGHYHAQQTILGDDGRPRAAYAGSLTAGGLDEQGEKGALVVELQDGACEVEFVALDQRRVRHVSCDLSGCAYEEEALRRAEAALAESGAASGDMILLELRGRRALALPLDALDILARGYFHLRIELSKLVPDIPLCDYPPAEQASTVEQRFVAQLRENVEQGDVTARQALFYGLDALHLGRLDTRYTD
ncbi:MAG TPA: metallophosphoesterase [Candidatus Krumholzibacteria bacterium]|jgi:DNA repair exonuclease SbcCD nuclease subunit